MSALLFDLGGTYLRAGFLSPDGDVEALEKRPIRNSVVHGLSEKAVWDGILGQMLGYEASLPLEPRRKCPIIISFPGPVVGNKRGLQAPTVFGHVTGELDCAAELERMTGRSVVLLNDVSAAAWRIAEITTANRFLVVTVSSGIGSKMFDRSHPRGVMDDSPYAGEIGHLVVDESPEAPLCDCGARGHLGAIASGRGIQRCVASWAARCPSEFQNSSMVRQFGASEGSLNNREHIVPAVLARDPWVTRLIIECTRPLVRSLLTVTVATDLDRVFIVGGFASALGARYLSIIRELARDMSQYPPLGDRLDSLFEVVTNEVCLDGCAAFVRKAGIAR